MVVPDKCFGLVAEGGDRDGEIGAGLIRRHTLHRQGVVAVADALDGVLDIDLAGGGVPLEPVGQTGPAGRGRESGARQGGGHRRGNESHA